ncbi:MAG TPA: hypothetical protein V6D00_11120 [Pantanalinema sp.]
MSTTGWFDRITASFAAVLRRRGGLDGHASSRAEEAAPEDRVRALIPIVRTNFGERAGDDPDVGAFEARVHDEASFNACVEVIALMGLEGFAYDPERLIAWLDLGISASTLYGVFDLTRPKDLHDLDALLGVLGAEPARVSVESLRTVASVYQQLGRPVAIHNLQKAIERLGGAGGTPAIATFLGCASAYEALGPVDASFDALLLDRVVDEEAMAATAALLDLVALRVKRIERYDDIRGLVEGVRDRITVRRLSKTLNLFEEYEVQVGDLDTFHLSFADSQAELEWLDRALKGMTELGRSVDRVVLMQLREWAPEIGALGRYLTAVRAFQSSGLSVDDIDRLVLKRVESEERSQVLGLVGELWFRLGLGDLSFERAEHLANTLTDRARLKRYETAVLLFKELKLSAGDVEALAEQFISSADDIYWLEAVLASAGDSEEKLGRIKILHLRERCPEPPLLYRYFRLKRAFDWLNADPQALDAWLIDAAPQPERTACLLALSEILQGDHRITLDEVQRHEAAFPTLELIEAYGVCVHTFNGDWRRFSVLLHQVRQSGDLETCFAIMSRTFEDARFSASQFQRALELLVAQEADAAADSSSDPSIPLVQPLREEA